MKEQTASQNVTSMHKLRSTALAFMLAVGAGGLLAACDQQDTIDGTDSAGQDTGSIGNTEQDTGGFGSTDNGGSGGDPTGGGMGDTAEGTSGLGGTGDGGNQTGGTTNDQFGDNSSDDNSFN